MASETAHSPAQAPPRRVVALPNVEAYNRWAATYDSDGNILQALDSYALANTMFSHFLRRLPRKDYKESPKSASQAADDATANDGALHITDLGCGTGRASLLLLSSLRSADYALAKAVVAKGYRTIYLTGLDSSPGMLMIANDRVPVFASIRDDLVLNTQFQEWDMMNPGSAPKPAVTDEDDNDEGSGRLPAPAHAVISTLVLEHLPLDVYFERARGLLRPQGVLLVTNMHPEMGNSIFSPAPRQDSAIKAFDNDYGAVSMPPTGAGFIDAATNTKIRPAIDYAHTIEQVIAAAKEAGFDLVDEAVDEMSVEPWMFDKKDYLGKSPLLGQRGRKWLGRKCWFGMVLRRSL